MKNMILHCIAVLLSIFVLLLTTGCGDEETPEEKLKNELKRKDMVIEVLKKNIEIQERMESDSRLLYKKTNTKQ